MKKPLKTIDVFFDKETTMLKPKELIEWLGAESLTLGDRRRFNLLLLNAWPEIATDKIHEISKAELRGSNKDMERVHDTMLRLMSLTPQVEVERQGRKFVRLFHVLEETETETDEDGEWRGVLRYRFSRPFCTVMKNSTQYAQLKKEVIYALPSKYALALYELVAKRVNLNKTSEVVDLKTFRAWLGVEENKLIKYSNLYNRAIKPAVAAVNALAEFECGVEPVKRGQKVVGVQLSWKKKGVIAKAAAIKEATGSKAGRAARIAGTVERIVDEKGLPPPRMSGLTTADIEQWREKFDGLDVDYYERLFKEWVGKQKTPIREYKAAFFGWTDMRIKMKIDEGF